MVEGRMDYALMPSLERRALIKTAIALWNHDDITALASMFHIIDLFLLRKGEWQKIEDKVIEKIQELPLPESLKKKVSDIIKPIGFEILKWRKYLDVIYTMERRDFHEVPGTTDTSVKKILNNLYWTPEGTIDRKKAAEVFITDENLDIKKHFKLACNCCFENDILMLLNKMPVGHIKIFYQTELEVFWTFFLRGQVTRMNNMIEREKPGCSAYQYAFEFAASDGNRVATEYFFQKLTSEEREESLVRSAGYACNSHRYHDGIKVEDFGGVLCFLLSQMNEEQQAEVFKNHPFWVLNYLLYWPWQSFFMETAKRMWAFLSEEHFDLLLSIIAGKARDGFKDYGYQKLIREFWQQSSTTYKQYSIENFHWGSLLTDVLQAKDKENIKLLLKSATVLDKQKIIFSRNILDCCGRLLYKDEMDLLEFFLQECLSSKDMMIKFREEFKRTVLSSSPVEEPEKQNVMMIKFREEFKRAVLSGSSVEDPEKEKVMLKKFSLLINNLIRKDGKRGLEEGNSGPVKRVRSLTEE